MATEPTQMITGDVMELHHLIYAERLAHAAEVAGLRAALKEWCDLASHLGLSTGGHRDRTHRLLAADPGPLVAAVEGVVRALEELKAQVDTENTLCEGELLGECPDLSGAYHQARAALAAYRAALKGEVERG